ncbi:helix-turn-helix transcriptional regulator [Dechloromonas sp. ARDL1]|uniref:helix-turn-helix transcriptional regulator n=1 Tax=Dechloromonas sp. ARDL1 TaxID=3322121 RepID=UPI003DA7862F
MPKLITLEEAADRIGVSRRTVDRYIERGQFVATYRLPTGHLRIDEYDLNEWLAACQTRNQLPEAIQ